MVQAWRGDTVLCFYDLGEWLPTSRVSPEDLVRSPGQAPGIRLTQKMGGIIMLLPHGTRCGFSSVAVLARLSSSCETFVLPWPSWPLPL